MNQAANDGATPVYVASQQGHTAALKLLLEKGGGDASQSDNRGASVDTPEDLALGGKRILVNYNPRYTKTSALTDDYRKGASSKCTHEWQSGVPTRIRGMTQPFTCRKCLVETELLLAQDHDIKPSENQLPTWGNTGLIFPQDEGGRRAELARREAEATKVEPQQEKIRDPEAERKRAIKAGM